MSDEDGIVDWYKIGQSLAMHESMNTMQGEQVAASTVVEPANQDPLVTVIEVGECCGNCRYFLFRSEGQGICRKSPPLGYIVGNGERTGSYYPPVQKTGWCGEFVKKP